MFQKKKIFKKIEKIKKIDKYYEKTKVWYDEELSNLDRTKLKEYLRSNSLIIVKNLSFSHNNENENVFS